MARIVRKVMTLNEILAANGFTTKPAGCYHKHILDTRGLIVFTGTAFDVWAWLRSGRCLKRLQASSKQYGSCEVCGEFVSDVWLCQMGTDYIFGHRACLVESLRYTRIIRKTTHAR